MSSVQKFLRQRVVGTTTYSIPASINNALYVLVSDNYVGNYGGTMVKLGDLPAASQLSQPTTNCVLRDMGKTVKTITTDNAAIPSLGKTPGFFRAVQIIQPLNNGTSGVGGGAPLSYNAGTGAPFSLPSSGNSGDKGYCTFYIPIVVDGVIASAPGGFVPLAPTAVNLLAGDVL